MARRPSPLGQSHFPQMYVKTFQCLEFYKKPPIPPIDSILGQMALHPQRIIALIEINYTTSSSKTWDRLKFPRKKKKRTTQLKRSKTKKAKATSSVRLDIVLFNVAIGACEKAGEWLRALGIFEEIQHLRLRRTTAAPVASKRSKRRVRLTPGKLIS